MQDYGTVALGMEDENVYVDELESHDVSKDLIKRSLKPLLKQIFRMIGQIIRRRVIIFLHNETKECTESTDLFDPD